MLAGLRTDVLTFPGEVDMERFVVGVTAPSKAALKSLLEARGWQVFIEPSLVHDVLLPLLEWQSAAGSQDHQASAPPRPPIGLSEVDPPPTS